jgi:hypothetical protein
VLVGTVVCVSVGYVVSLVAGKDVAAVRPEVETSNL